MLTKLFKLSVGSFMYCLDIIYLHASTSPTSFQLLLMEQPKLLL